MEAHLFRIVAVAAAFAFLIFFCLIVWIIHLCRKEPLPEIDSDRTPELQKVAKEKKRATSAMSSNFKTTPSGGLSQRNRDKDDQEKNIQKLHSGMLVTATTQIIAAEIGLTADTNSETASIAEFSKEPVKRKNTSLVNLFPGNELPFPDVE